MQSLKGSFSRRAAASDDSDPTLQSAMLTGSLPMLLCYVPDSVRSQNSELSDFNSQSKVNVCASAAAVRREYLRTDGMRQ